MPLVVFSRDDAGKPHASRFEASEAALAEKAAGLMGMRVLRLDTVEYQELAAPLPRGRLFGSGRAFVPFVKGALFERLDSAPNAFTPERPLEAAVNGPGEPVGGRLGSGRGNPAAEPTDGADGATSPLADWGSIGGGDIVLAAEEGYPTWWYVAVVVSQRGPDLFELRWGDWPELPLFVRRREHLGLLPPGFKLDCV